MTCKFCTPPCTGCISEECVGLATSRFLCNTAPIFKHFLPFRYGGILLALLESIQYQGGISHEKTHNSRNSRSITPCGIGNSYPGACTGWERGREYEPLGLTNPNTDTNQAESPGLFGRRIFDKHGNCNPKRQYLWTGRRDG
jgi:hypothetical protein